MNRTLLLAVLVAALIVYQASQQQPEEEGASPDPQDEGLLDAAMTKIDEAVAVIAGPGPVEDMVTSDAMRSQLKRREALRLTRYQLGDGGYTWGYGHFDKNPNALPLTITRQQAEDLFDRDLVERGEKWVKLYIKVPISQNQFDALVSLAYNMSPKSFKKFAETVNSGEGPQGLAMESVAWVPASLQNGVRNRRLEEMNTFYNGVYA